MWNNCNFYVEKLQRICGINANLRRIFSTYFFAVFSVFSGVFSTLLGVRVGKEVRKENLTLCHHNLYAGDVPSGCRMRKQTTDGCRKYCRESMSAALRRAWRKRERKLM